MLSVPLFRVFLWLFVLYFAQSTLSVLVFRFGTCTLSFRCKRSLDLDGLEERWMYNAICPPPPSFPSSFLLCPSAFFGIFYSEESLLK